MATFSTDLARLVSATLSTLVVLLAPLVASASAQASGEAVVLTSVRSGCWENPRTWSPPRVPGAGDAVRIAERHRVTVHGFKRASSLTLAVDATLVAAHRAPDVEIWCAGPVVNRGEVRGGSSLAGGHVVLRATSLENHGLIKAGDGAEDGFGGLVRIECSGRFSNGIRGRICGGYGGTLDCEVTGGDGGAVDIDAGGAAENRGHIAGGRGADGAGAVHGRGGFVRVHTASTFVNRGRVRGGVGPASAADGEVFVTGAAVRMLGRGGVFGGLVVVQAERESIVLDSKRCPTLEATAGPVRLIAAGAIVGTPSTGRPIASTPTRVEIIARVDETLDLTGGDGTTTVIRRRARIDSARLGAIAAGADDTDDPATTTTVLATIHSPDDAGRQFIATLAPSRGSGTLLAPFGEIDLDRRPTDHATRVGSRSIRGRLDRRGRAHIRLPWPTDVRGSDCFIAAVILEPEARTIVNVTPARRIVGRSIAPGSVEVAAADQATRTNTSKLSAKNPK